MQGNSRGASETRAACIDAETLAAWADGGLSPSDAASVETHLADCDRCTAMLATFVRTTPEAPVAESLWTRWHLRWLVPVATAATVAALFVLLPRPGPPEVATVGSAPTTEAPLSAPQEAAPSTTQAPAEKKEQEARSDVRQATPADTLAKRSEPAAAPPQLADEQRAGAAAERLQAAPANQAFAAPPPPAREADAADAKSADARSERFSPPIPSASTAPAAPATAPPAPQAAAPAQESAGSTAFGVAPGTRARAVGELARGTTPIVEIASPDPMFRWRVVGAGQVERTTNGGAQWTRATLPESATLTGGSSPSPSVCWLVGRTGSIYVTTDGLRFVRVPFGDRTDFVSIRATDGRRATVVTIDGRTMQTDDQGATWIRVNP